MDNQDKSEKDNMPMIIGAIVLIAVLAIGGVAFAVSQNDDSTDDVEETQQEDTAEESEEVSLPNIVENAQNTEAVSTLVEAVVAANLVDVLADETAEYTVFAPTNEAFAALPEGTLESLLLEERVEDLASILTYHVIPQALTAEKIIEMDGETVETVNGEELTIIVDGSNVTIQGGTEDNIATVTIADVESSNGIIHVIDTVLLPAN